MTPEELAGFQAAHEAGRKQAETEIAAYARGYLHRFIELGPALMRPGLRIGADKLCDLIRDGAYRAKEKTT